MKRMKLNFKKIASVLAGTVMLSSTLAFAAAANTYPTPFVKNGSADVAVVYGSNPGGELDLLAVVDVTTSLQAKLAAQTATSGSTSGATASGGDYVKIEGTSSKFGLGDKASSVLVTSLNADKMPTLLADGVYTDQDNTEFKYTQKLALGNAVQLNHFSDSDYKDKVPTVGINLSDSQVLNYTLDFDTDPEFTAAAMETTTLKMMGKEYYVLDVQNSSSPVKLTLLDSANSLIVAEGQNQSVSLGNKTYDISISYVSETKAKLLVNGELTNSLSEGGTFKLKDGTYVGIKSILFNTKDTGVSKVELSVGKGKLELEDGQAIQLNDDTINEIVGHLSLDTSAVKKIDQIKLVWTTDGKAFITPDSSITMPGFESVKIAMADFFTPAKEVTTVKNSGSDVIELRAPIKTGDATIPLLYATTGTYTDTGKDSNNQLAGTNIGAAGSFWFNQTAGDKYIIASWNSTTEAETYYLKVEMVTEDSVNKTRFTNVLDSSDSKTVSAGNDVSFGNVVITPSSINVSGTLKWAYLTAGSGVSFDSLYTNEGMKVYLPYVNSTNVNIVGSTEYTATTACTAVTGSMNQTQLYTGTVSYNSSSTHASATTTCTTKLYLSEQDKDKNLAKKDFSLTLSKNSDNKVQVSAVNSADNGFEIGDSSNYEYYIISDLATKIVTHTGDDQDWAEVTYAGGESYANAFISSPMTVVTAGASGSNGSVKELGTVFLKDTEVAQVSGKNLIVVGGSCVNQLASQLLGGAGCGASWETKTGVGAGSFLIQTFERTGGKVATLVAGYNVDDTRAAAKVLVSDATVDLSAGKTFKGTTATKVVTAVTA